MSARAIAGAERPPDAPRSRAADPRRSVRDRRSRPLRRGDPGHRAGQVAPAARARRMRHVLDRVAALARPLAELPRQQRVGRLIRRQVRRDVEDVHAVRLSAVRAGGTPRTSTGVGAEVPAWRTRGTARADRRTRRAPPAVRLYGLPPTMASLEWKSRFSTGSPAAREAARERHHVVQRRIRRPQPAQPQQSERAQHALGRVGPRRARVRVLQPLRQPPVQRRRDRHLQHAAACRAGSRCRRRGSTASAAPRRTRGRPCAPRRRAARRSIRRGSPSRSSAGDVRGREPETARSVRHRPRADGVCDRFRQRRELILELARAAGSTHRDAGGRRRRVHGGVSQA